MYSAVSAAKEEEIEEVAMPGILCLPKVGMVRKKAQGKAGSASEGTRKWLLEILSPTGDEEVLESVTQRSSSESGRE